MAKINCVILYIAIISAGFTRALLKRGQPSLSSPSHYTAGVVDFSRSHSDNLSSQEHLQNNLDGYLRIITSPEAVPTDILVFPESTLNNRGPFTFVPDPQQGVIPCDAPGQVYHDFLRSLSCAARNGSKYVVVNLSEKESCCHPNDSKDPRPCSGSGLNVYNTNVVFDREGRVTSRYRKQHLYGEQKNTTYTPEFGVFDTDFGVRFGHFVCFDIMFYAPAQEMAHSMGIKDFIFTSMWFGQLPFLTGVQIQSSWSYANDVNLLAAGANNPATGTAGTGIYIGRQQPLVAVMNRRVGVRQLYVAKVPKRAQSYNRAKRQTMLIKSESATTLLPEADIILKRDYLEMYATELVNVTHDDRLQRRLCYNENFCCDFELSWQPLERTTANHSLRYSYRLGAYEGWRNTKGGELNQIKNCAVFACIGEDIEDCGRLLPGGEEHRPPQVVFNRVLIEAFMPNAPHYLLMPNSLCGESLLPLPVNSFQWNVTDWGSGQQVRFLMNSTATDLLTFAIYGNYYDSHLKDGGSNSTSNEAVLFFRSATSLVALFGSLTLALNYFIP